MIDFIRKHIESEKNAFEGIASALRTEPNMRIEFVISAFVLLAALLLNCTRVEWLFILSAIFGVIVAETVNTAIEDLGDAITKKYDEKIKRAKDVAAASVVYSAIYALLVGVVIFMPKLITVINFLL